MVCCELSQFFKLANNLQLLMLIATGSLRDFSVEGENGNLITKHPLAVRKGGGWLKEIQTLIVQSKLLCFALLCFALLKMRDLHRQILRWQCCLDLHLERKTMFDCALVALLWLDCALVALLWLDCALVAWL